MIKPNPKVAITHWTGGLKYKRPFEVGIYIPQKGFHPTCCEQYVPIERFTSEEEAKMYAHSIECALKVSVVSQPTPEKHNG